MWCGVVCCIQAADEQSAAKAAVASGALSKSKAAAVADAHARAKQMLRGQTRTAANANANANAKVAEAVNAQSKSKSQSKSRVRSRSRSRSRVGAGDPFPDQPFTYKDVSSPPEWLVPEESEPAGPTTKPPPVPQMIPPPPPVPFPTYNYHDPNSAGPFSQFAPGVQGSGYDGGYNGPYDGFSMYGHPPNEAQSRGIISYHIISSLAPQPLNPSPSSQPHPSSLSHSSLQVG